MIFRRSHNETETQVYFTLRHDLSEVLGVSRAPVEEQKAFWTERFQGAGWETERFLEGLKTTENFYCQEIVQVKINKWHEGRVVLLGDAAHCPSPFSGMGTTSSLVGAYVLAGEIERNHENLSKALQDYEAAVRPFIDQIQTPSPFWLRVLIPETSFGIAIISFIAMVLCFFRIPELAARFTPEGKMGWKLPDYADASSKNAAQDGRNGQKEDRA
jgi:2-polyprenyl-6-methoxyphenol hydroxylase-like FAD-dependent oxidoreductase